MRKMSEPAMGRSVYGSQEFSYSFDEKQFLDGEGNDTGHIKERGIAQANGFYADGCLFDHLVSISKRKD